ncbi:MAG TPA: phosphatase PAP2 family protein [Bryobacteraceae bacterium]|jgi:membrane-associated phospholipid phosphatase
MPRLRSSEWLAIVYFLYVAAIAPFYIVAPWRALLLAAIIAGGFLLLSRGPQVLRDLAPLAATLAAYREMNWFTPAVQDHHLERSWIVWDRALLDGHGLRAAIESAGMLLPGYLELCYLLVYAVGPVVVAAAIFSERRHRTDHLWIAYLAGTLGAYALFPYFPSEPPRTVFAGEDLPHVVTVIRQLNLWIVGGYGIHSSVFPSAHVSSAFSAAWGLLAVMREKRWMGWTMLVYAVSVSIATVYGRYHYGVDAVAGFAVSLLAIPAAHFARERT